MSGTEPGRAAHDAWASAEGDPNDWDEDLDDDRRAAWDAAAQAAIAAYIEANGRDPVDARAVIAEAIAPEPFFAWADRTVDAEEAVPTSPASGLLCDNDEVMTSLMRALFDPGSVTPRAPLESLPSWQRRAVVEHAAPHIIAHGLATAEPVAVVASRDSVAPELAGLRKALHAIALGIAEPSPRAVAEDALNGRYLDPNLDSGVWHMEPPLRAVPDAEPQSAPGRAAYEAAFAHEYCVAHDQPIDWCAEPDRCREQMRAWGLYADPAANGAEPDISPGPPRSDLRITEAASGAERAGNGDGQ